MIVGTVASDIEIRKLRSHHSSDFLRCEYLPTLPCEHPRIAIMICHRISPSQDCSWRDTVDNAETGTRTGYVSLMAMPVSRLLSCRKATTNIKQHSVTGITKMAGTTPRMPILKWSVALCFQGGGSCRVTTLRTATNQLFKKVNATVQISGHGGSGICRAALVEVSAESSCSSPTSIQFLGRRKVP